MSQNSLAEELVDNFLLWLSRSGEGFHYLSAAFSEWWTEGDAIEQTGGDYTVFLRVFILTAAQLLERPEEFPKYVGDKSPPKLIEMGGVEGEQLPLMMEREYWELDVFRYKYANRGRTQ